MILHGNTTGSGPDLVLLHGLFGAGRNLGVIARGLADRFRVTSLDARNHGESPHAPDMRYTTMAADVAETMASRGIAQAVVVGHSMGGKTAMMLALARPELVSSVAVLDIAPIAYGHEHLGFIEAMRAVDLHPGLTRQVADAALVAAVKEPELRGFLLHNLVLGDKPRWRLGLDEIAGSMDDLVGWSDPAAGASYDGPSLFMSGANSSYVPASAHEAILARFPRAEIASIAGVGHWLHAEKPAEVLAMLRGFLRV